MNTLHNATAVLAGLAITFTLSACGGSSDTTQDSAEPSTPSSASTSTEPTSTPSPSIDPDIYLLENREQFLAAGPDCAAMTAWYDANPTDVDVTAVGRHIELCNSFPPALIDNEDAIDDATEAILASGIAMTDPARVRVHANLAVETCDIFDSGSRSPYTVGTTVADLGGSPADYRKVIARAAEECPEHRDDLTAFTAPDIVTAADELATFVGSNWPQAIGTFPEWIAAAQFVCAEKQGRVDDAAMFVQYITGPDEVDQFVEWTDANLC